MSMSVRSRSGARFRRRQSFPLYDETATVTSNQPIQSGVVFDVSGGYRVWRRVALGVGLSSVQKQWGCRSHRVDSRPRILRSTDDRDREHVRPGSLGAWRAPAGGLVDPGHRQDRRLVVRGPVIHPPHTAGGDRFRPGRDPEHQRDAEERVRNGIRYQRRVRRQLHVPSAVRRGRVRAIRRRVGRSSRRSRTSRSGASRAGSVFVSASEATGLFNR